jgi:hypothetical protein
MSTFSSKNERSRVVAMATGMIVQCTPGAIDLAMSLKDMRWWYLDAMDNDSMIHTWHDRPCHEGMRSDCTIHDRNYQSCGGASKICGNDGWMFLFLFSCIAKALEDTKRN